MWYGLKEGNTIVAVRYCRGFEPTILDFNMPIGIRKAYTVVVVRIREVGVATED